MSEGQQWQVSVSRRDVDEMDQGSEDVINDYDDQDYLDALDRESIDMDLFLVDAFTIHPKPMFFSFYPSTKGVSTLIRAIERGGGFVLNHFPEIEMKSTVKNVITIVNLLDPSVPEMVVPHDCFSIMFLLDCIKSGDVSAVNLNDFRSAESSFEPFNANEILHWRKSWHDLTKLSSPPPLRKLIDIWNELDCKKRLLKAAMKENRTDTNVQSRTEPSTITSSVPKTAIVAKNTPKRSDINLIQNNGPSRSTNPSKPYGDFRIQLESQADVHEVPKYGKRIKRTYRAKDSDVNTTDRTRTNVPPNSDGWYEPCLNRAAVPATTAALSSNLATNAGGSSSYSGQTFLTAAAGASSDRTVPGVPTASSPGRTSAAPKASSGRGIPVVSSALSSGPAVLAAATASSSGQAFLAAAASSGRTVSGVPTGSSPIRTSPASPKASSSDRAAPAVRSAMSLGQAVPAAATASSSGITVPGAPTASSSGRAILEANVAFSSDEPVPCHSRSRPIYRQPLPHKDKDDSLGAPARGNFNFSDTSCSISADESDDEVEAVDQGRQNNDGDRDSNADEADNVGIRRRPDRVEYSTQHGQAILDYILRKRLTKYVCGNGIWKKMEENKVLDHLVGRRTFSSLRNHFIKSIIPNIEKPTGHLKYKISPENLRQFKQDRKAMKTHKGANVPPASVLAKIKREK